MHRARCLNCNLIVPASEVHRTDADCVRALKREIQSVQRSAAFDRERRRQVDLIEFFYKGAYESAMNGLKRVIIPVYENGGGI
jgi:hypothetical protein